MLPTEQGRDSMYLLGEAGGWRAQETVWSMLHQGDLEIAFQGADDYERMRVLMQKYRDRPMDLVDACSSVWLKNGMFGISLRWTMETFALTGFTGVKVLGYGRQNNPRSSSFNGFGF